MRRWYPRADDSLGLRVLWLYGMYMLISNAASEDSFGGELVLTLAFNMGVVVVVAAVMNPNRVRGFPVGYLYPLLLGVVSGLIPGTNSFVASDLADYSVREGMALSLSIGHLEMLGYVCVIAATTGIALYEYKSWWRWGGEWKATKTGSFRDIRLSRSESAVAVVGIMLVLAAAVRETMMAYGLL